MVGQGPTVLRLEFGSLGASVVENSLCLLELGPVFSCLVLHGARDLLHAHLGGGKYGGKE